MVEHFGGLSQYLGAEVERVKTHYMVWLAKQQATQMKEQREWESRGL